MSLRKHGQYMVEVLLGCAVMAADRLQVVWVGMDDMVGKRWVVKLQVTGFQMLRLQMAWCVHR